MSKGRERLGAFLAAKIEKFLHFLKELKPFYEWKKILL